MATRASVGELGIRLNMSSKKNTRREWIPSRSDAICRHAITEPLSVVTWENASSCPLSPAPPRVSSVEWSPADRWDERVSAWACLDEADRDAGRAQGPAAPELSAVLTRRRHAASTCGFYLSVVYRFRAARTHTESSSRPVWTFISPSRRQ